MAKRAKSKPARVKVVARSATRAARSLPAAPAAVVRPVEQARPAGSQPHPQALELFRKGMEALQRHAYKPAGETFKSLIERFPAEGALIERTRLYLDLCVRELKRRPPEPRTIEERLAVATAALNSWDDVLAERLARSVLAEDARQELALYLMAAIEARRGEADAAVAFLARAVEVSPEVRAQARHDSDFEILRHVDGYRALIDPPSGASSGTRERRRFR